VKLPTLLIALSLGLTATAFNSPQDAAKPMNIVEQYHALSEAADMDGLVALWTENEYRALSAIDQDLEGSLALWESGLDPEKTAAMEGLQARAMFGAAAATKAFDRPIFLDYASAFCSWNDAEKAAFRGGQAANGRAYEAKGEGKLEAARDAAEECTALALPLGDWWGCAMGLGGSGSFKLELGDAKGGLSDLSRARLINQSLGLRGSELRNLKGMLACLTELGHTPRAITVCQELIEASEGEELAKFKEQLKQLQGE
jgi:hypothetical protein